MANTCSMAVLPHCTSPTSTSLQRAGAAGTGLRSRMAAAAAEAQSAHPPLAAPPPQRPYIPRQRRAPPTAAPTRQSPQGLPIRRPMAERRGPAEARLFGCEAAPPGQGASVCLQTEVGPCSRPNRKWWLLGDRWDAGRWAGGTGGGDGTDTGMGGRVSPVVRDGEPRGRSDGAWGYPKVWRGALGGTPGGGDRGG